MRCKVLDSRARRGNSDDVPEYLRCHSSSPHPTSLVNRPEESTFLDASRIPPLVNGNLNPAWNWNGTHMSSFTQKVHDSPMLLAQLDGLNAQRRQFAAAKSASD
jgi:hypothetical protein